MLVRAAFGRMYSLAEHLFKQGVRNVTGGAMRDGGHPSDAGYNVAESLCVALCVALSL